MTDKSLDLKVSPIDSDPYYLSVKKLFKKIIPEECSFKIVKAKLVLNLKKIITIGSVVLISALLIYGFILARQIFSDNTKFPQKELYVYVPTGSNYEDVKKLIDKSVYK